MKKGVKGRGPAGNSRFPFRGALSGEKGVALMMVLWVLVLLGIISLNYFRSNRWNTAGTRNFKEETLAYYMAMSGYQEAVRYLLSDKNPSLDFVDPDGNFWTDNEQETVTGKRTTDEGEIEITITDENAKVNINYADGVRLGNIFRYMGISEDEILALVDSILDWKDSGDMDATMPNGAESDYYEDLENPYTAKNMAFDIPEELLLVKGMKPEYFKSGEEQTSLLNLITTFGTVNTLNINTVSKEVMQLLQFDESEMEAIMKQRTREAGGFSFIPPQFSAKGLNAIVSQNIRIEVLARARNSSLGIKVIAVLNRRPDPSGYKIYTLYWKEDAETIRG